MSRYTCKCKYFLYSREDNILWGAFYFLLHGLQSPFCMTCHSSFKKAHFTRYFSPFTKMCWIPVHCTCYEHELKRYYQEPLEWYVDDAYFRMYYLWSQWLRCSHSKFRRGTVSHSSLSGTGLPLAAHSWEPQSGSPPRPWSLWAPYPSKDICLPKSAEEM